MSLYPEPLETSIQQAAQRAAQAKRDAIDGVLRALSKPERAGATGAWHAILDELADDSRPLSCALLADAMRQRGRRRDAAIRVRNACRFLLQQLVHPSQDRWDYLADLNLDLLTWLRNVQAACQWRPTPLVEGEVLADLPSVPAVSPAERDALGEARQGEIRARQEINRLVDASFAGAWPDGGHCNPLRMESQRVLQRFPVRTLTPDDLMAEGLRRLYDRIDAYHTAQAPFLAWWHVLVRNRFVDLERRERPTVELCENADHPVTDNVGPGSGVRDDHPQEPFTDQDWQRICGWAEHNLLSAVVVLVGFGWLDKVKWHAPHWEECCQWLEQIGVDDVPAYDAARQATGQWTTTRQLRVLAEHAQRKPNSLSQHFHRKFKGIEQTVRQESFGKKHLAVQLDYFWQVTWRTAPRVPDRLQQQLQQTATDPRVTALCCCPAWHLLGRRERWSTACAGYPFQRVPPLLELLRNDFQIARPELIPPHLSHRRDVQSYVREVLLAHGTQGQLAQVRERLRESHEQCRELETELRPIADQTTYG
jgi:hypothetical protein